MSTHKRPKKAALADWHPADVVAALRKAGWSLRRLSAHHGYAPTSLKKALHMSWPKAERLVAEAIGIPPERIWPSRYSQDSASGKRASSAARSGRRAA